MGDIHTAEIPYSHAATHMRGHFAAPATPAVPCPGVLIVHDAFGLDWHCIGIAERLAALGYAALAMDLWGDRRQFSGPDTVMGCIAGLQRDRDDWMGRVAAAQAALATQPGVDATRIAAIGYCLGGSTVLEYARSGGAIRAAVSFHGGLELVGMPWRRDAVNARLLICTGDRDPLVPWPLLATFRDALLAGDIDWELAVYSGARHSFTRTDAAERGAPERSGYDARADRRSWRAMLDLLHETLTDAHPAAHADDTTTRRVDH